MTLEANIGCQGGAPHGRCMHGQGGCLPEGCLTLQAAQHMSEAIADMLRSRATAAWGPALSAADLLYRVTPIDLEAPLTAFAESLCSKPTVRQNLPQASSADTPKQSGNKTCMQTSFCCAAACQRRYLSADFSSGLPHVQVGLGCAAVLAHAACFSAKPLRMFAEVLKVKQAAQAFARCICLRTVSCVPCLCWHTSHKEVAEQLHLGRPGLPLFSSTVCRYC